MFQTIAKIGTGFEDDELIDIKNRADAIKINTKPFSIDCAEALYPDIWINPEIVCSIRADEITISPLHTAGKTEYSLGYALRFPRFMGYRPDKDAKDATTTDEIITLYNSEPRTTA